MEQRSEEWFNARLGMFTASKFGDLMTNGRKEKFGQACLTYVYDIIAEITIGTSHQSFSNSATEWGTENEDNAIFHYEMITGNSVDRVGFINYLKYDGGGLRGVGGSPDGLVNDNGLIEVKCPFNPANHIKFIIEEEIPKAHYWQMMGLMMVTGRDWCDYVSYDPRQDEQLMIHIVRLERDEDMIKLLLERIHDLKDLIDEKLKIKGYGKSEG